MRTWAKSLAGSGNVMKNLLAGDMGFGLQTVQETAKKWVWPEQRAYKKRSQRGNRGPISVGLTGHDGLTFTLKEMEFPNEQWAASGVTWISLRAPLAAVEIRL